MKTHEREPKQKPAEPVDDEFDDTGAGKRRPRTIPARRLTREEMRVGAELRQSVQYRRPQLRSECREGQRPCPFVSCKFNLYLDVNPETGSIKLNFPDKEIWEVEQSCALDVAEKGGSTLEEIGLIMNLTRERIRQLENSGLTKIKEGTTDIRLKDFEPG
ncbi:MAG: DNA-binding protein [Deltaproteobacteria bacterium]|nr:DNA-binding protein [Deltaproteobacteria bacterium]